MDLHLKELGVERSGIEIQFSKINFRIKKNLNIGKVQLSQNRF
jgi:hypothetical protein